MLFFFVLSAPCDCMPLALASIQERQYRLTEPFLTTLERHPDRTIICTDNTRPTSTLAPLSIRCLRRLLWKFKGDADRYATCGTVALTISPRMKASQITSRSVMTRQQADKLTGRQSRLLLLLRHNLTFDLVVRRLGDDSLLH